MANIINIANKLNNEQKFINLGNGKQYKVNDSYKALVQSTALFEQDNKDNAQAMMDSIALLLGEDARREAEEMPVQNVQVLFVAVMAAVQNVSYEEMEKRFRESAEEQ